MKGLRLNSCSIGFIWSLEIWINMIVFKKKWCSDLRVFKNCVVWQKFRSCSCYWLNLYLATLGLNFWQFYFFTQSHGLCGQGIAFGVIQANLCWKNINLNGIWFSHWIFWAFISLVFALRFGDRAYFGFQPKCDCSAKVFIVIHIIFPNAYYVFDFHPFLYWCN